MNWSNPSTTAVVIGVVVLLAATAVVTWAFLRRRRNEWQRFARHHDFKYREGADGLVVAGDVDGRPFKLDVSTESSDTGFLGVENVEMILGLKSRVPDGMEVLDAGGVLGEADRMIEPEAAATGDQEFDRQVLVRGNFGQPASEYLTPKRRGAVLKFLAEEPSCQIRIAGSEFVAQEREIVANVVKLDARLERMLAAAAAFDED